jgi:hypothetical protein
MLSLRTFSAVYDADSFRFQNPEVSFRISNPSSFLPSAYCSIASYTICFFKGTHPLKSAVYCGLIGVIHCIQTDSNRDRHRLYDTRTYSGDRVSLGEHDTGAVSKVFLREGNFFLMFFDLLTECTYSIVRGRPIMEERKDIIEEGYDKALEVLRENSTRYGFSASSERSANYYSVWARDHALSTLGVVLSADDGLISCAKRGIGSILDKQSDNGQVPSYIEVPVAGDWADIFPRVHHVLYDEVLFYEALEALHFVFARAVEHNPGLRDELGPYLNKISDKKKLLDHRINGNLWFTRKGIEAIREQYMIINDIPKRDYGFYQSYVMPFRHYWYERFESFGNILAIITGIADEKRRNSIINHVFDNKINRPFPLKALFPHVNEGDRDWEEIFTEKERPHHYHNGGIWPIIGGLWIHVLAKAGHPRAREELETFAAVLNRQDWGFNEYMHGETGEPLGKENQSWSAAGYIIAYHAFHPECDCFYWGVD